MKRLLFILFSVFIIPTTVFAADIDLNIDKTSFTTDDVAHIIVSVNGPVDGGQIGIAGLDNFEIVGQSSSQSMQIINGQTSQVQKKEIIIKSNKSGNFTIQALAQDNGKKISSKKIIISVEDSLIDTTKKKLLQDSQNEQSTEKSEEVNNIQQDIQDGIIEPQTDFPDDILTTPQNQTQLDNNKDTAKTNELSTKQIENFPQIKQISAFNTFFWVEFVGILIGIIILIMGIFWIFEKIKNK